MVIEDIHPSIEVPYPISSFYRNAFKQWREVIHQDCSFGEFTKCGIAGPQSACTVARGKFPRRPLPVLVPDPEVVEVVADARNWSYLAVRTFSAESGSNWLQGGLLSGNEEGLHIDLDNEIPYSRMTMLQVVDIFMSQNTIQPVISLLNAFENNKPEQGHLSTTPSLVIESFKNGHLVDTEPVVDIFMSQNMIQPATSVLDALKGNKPEQGHLQTHLNLPYELLVVGKFCEARDPYLAYIAYAKGLCDEELIAITNDNSMSKQQACYLLCPTFGSKFSFMTMFTVAQSLTSLLASRPSNRANRASGENRC
ncbi:hypothetical protein BDZ97DRAFT_2060149 [Flammula alnicola]|nr:hypothetical protein BDZ97DRAFT_2060149 [Flammula alnicola]